MDKTNVISKTLLYIGIIIIILGTISSFIVASYADDSLLVGMSGTLGSFISGMFFIGISEIINLLQQNVDNQEKLFRQLNKTTTVIRKTTENKKENQEDSVSKSTNSTSNNTHKHLFRCENCGNMISKSPCIYCGNNPEN